jgi:hypothetical protein
MLRSVAAARRPTDNKSDSKKGDTMEMIDVAQVSELRDLIAQFAPRNGDHQTSIASLCLMRRSSSLVPEFTILSPALCLATQGQKEFLLGADVYTVGSGYHLVASTTFRFPHAFWKRRPSNPSWARDWSST